MGISERRDRQRSDRERQIVTVARNIAERDGWGAVTIRRLADEIEYSQPVLYSHFENRDAIVASVAIEGFREIAAVLLEAARASSGQRHVIEKVAMAYLDFALRHPAVYEAMFVLPTKLRFADAETMPELQAAFQALAQAVEPYCEEVEAGTETFWATLHGLTELERSGRIRPGARVERINLVVEGIIASRQMLNDRRTP